MSQDSELKRELGLLEVTLSGVGIIVGAGIYALIGPAAGMAGNAVWLSFGIAALIALFTGLSYAELSSMFPKASAEYEYTNHAFGRRIAFVVGWMIIFSGVTGSSTVALGFGGYFSSITGISVLISSILLIPALSLIILYGIKESAWVAIIFTLIEISGLVLIIFIGIPHLGSVDYFEMPYGFGGIFGAAALVFFAYMGFEDIVKLSEETKNPEKVIPKGLVLALVITIILYMLVPLSAVSVLGWEQLGSSKAPFSDVAYVALGNSAYVLVSVIALFATANTVLIILLVTSRIIYGMAASFSLPHQLARIHPKRRTPWVAIIATMVVSMIFVLAEDIAFVASVNDFILFLTFMVINASLIFLRYREPGRPRPFRVPLTLGRMPLLPVMGIFSCIFLTLHLEGIVMLVGSALVMLGGIVSLLAAKISERSSFK